MHNFIYEHPVLFCIAILLLLIAILVIVRILQLILYPDWCPFPVVTRCSVCKKRIYVWQKRERITLPLQFTGDVLPWTTGWSSTLIHKSCSGKPAVSSKVHVTITSC